MTFDIFLESPCTMCDNSLVCGTFFSAVEKKIQLFEIFNQCVCFIQNIIWAPLVFHLHSKRNGYVQMQKIIG